MDRSRTPPIRYVLQANFGYVALPSAASQREFALFCQRIGGFLEVVSLRSVPESFKFAMFYKRNSVVLDMPANPRNANSLCFTSEFDVSQLGPTA